MKYLNKNTKLFLMTLMIGWNASCTDKFIEMNTNPNTSLVATPESLLAPAIHSVISTNLSRAMLIGNELMQVHVTTRDTREFHRYEFTPESPDYMWRNWYLQLTNIRDIYTNASITQGEGYQTLQAISLILDVWVSSLITDMYGDVPYTEAVKGREGVIQPAFDRQKDIYEDLFRKLEQANLLLMQSSNLSADIRGLDPLYNGSAINWRKFGNSLYLRLLLRVSGKVESEAIGVINRIVEVEPDNYPVFVNNQESAILRFTPQPPLVSPFQDRTDMDFNTDKGYAEFFIDNLNDWGDPRLPLWATRSGDGFAGMPSGYPPGMTPSRKSSLPASLRNEPLLGNILNYAELQFILAECALKGYISGEPKDFYDEGITNAITHWGVTVPPGHLEKQRIRWDDQLEFEDKMNRILLQKYYALFFTDFQSWYEHRRTGHPVLPVGESVFNNGRMPARVMYPLSIQALNPDNFREAVANMGGDNINIRVWWNTED